MHSHGDVTIIDEWLQHLGTDLYRVLYAMERGLNLSNLIRRTNPFSRFVRQAKGTSIMLKISNLLGGCQYNLYDMITSCHIVNFVFTPTEKI